MQLYDGRAEFYQYDTNQKLICDSCNVGEEIHFSNKFYTKAAVCLTYEFEGQVVVNVPNSYLMCSGELIAYCVRTDKEGRSTIDRHSFTINARKKPSDYVYEETEVLGYASLEKRIRQLEEGGVDENEVRGIIEDYMEENPIEVPEVDLSGMVKSVNGNTPDENGNVEIDTMPDGSEQIELLIEADMLPAVATPSGAILTDNSGNVILRY
jgi:hypothetical protein